MIFSYHHSREDGWTAVARAVVGAGFSLIQSQPVKSEMSVAAPKTQAKEPIDLDVLLVCKKRTEDRKPRVKQDVAAGRASATAAERVARFNRSGRRLSRNDVRVILLSQLLVELSPGRGASEIAHHLDAVLPEMKDTVERIWSSQEIFEEHTEDGAESPQAQQLTLFR